MAIMEMELSRILAGYENMMMIEFGNERHPIGQYQQQICYFLEPGYHFFDC